MLTTLLRRGGMFNERENEPTEGANAPLDFSGLKLISARSYSESRISRSWCQSLNCPCGNYHRGLLNPTVARVEIPNGHRNSAHHEKVNTAPSASPRCGSRRAHYSEILIDLMDMVEHQAKKPPSKLGIRHTARNLLYYWQVPLGILPELR